ncbi:PREDICTED: odorant receptor 43a-like [Polistes dominula]|uniref:Odorant receptor n=1 Tax=Polistes dominula TaxID=743375 RepID=A0ABM1IGI2_POLDO|nr:PREDICTED: odorant receptor 43a-like [Polistes dominula]
MSETIELEDPKIPIVMNKNRNELALNYSVKIGRGILRIIGGWPLDDETSIVEKIYSYFANAFCYFLFTFILLPGLLRIFVIEQNVRIRLKIFGPLCTCSINATKYSILMTRGKKIKECMKHVKDDWKKVVLEKDYESMMSHAKVGRTLAVMSASFIYGAGMSYRTILPLSKGKMIIGNLTIRPLACPSYFVIFNEQETPAYELVFFGQFLAGFAVYSVACGVCGLATFLIMHVCGQLEILMRMMRDIVDEKNDNDSDPDKRIAEVIQHQTRARNFVKDVEEILQYMCMVEILGCTSLEWENSDTTGLVTYFIFLLSFAFNMFIFCYIGELLSEQGMKVGVTSCTLNWNRLPTKSARSLVLIILASNHPIKIVAGKLMDMSLSNFNNIIKTAVGYFNILRSSV